jgi:acetylornithine deacetylase/succinyl-diaminopimelate desuccinylase-like protein
MKGPVRAWVEAHEGEIVALLCDMIRVDSVTGREGPMAELCADWLRRHGIEAVLQPAKDRWNAIGVVGSGQPTLLLAGHLDTVPPNEGAWTHGPWTPTVADGRVVGLGASDLHASIVGAYFAQRFLVERGLRPEGRLVSVFTIEEETTGDGTQLFLDWAERERFLDFGRTQAIVTEPTGLTHVCLGNRASSFVVIRVKGLGGHGSRPHLARNPVAKLLDVLAGLRALEARWKPLYSDPDFGHPTLTPTCVRSGDLDRTNVIPELAQAVVDCRPTPRLWADDLALFRAELGACLRSFREEGFAIDWEELYPREGHKLEREHPLAATVLRVLREDLGIGAAEFRYTPAGNDSVFFGLKGIPTVNKVGPGHPECAHRVNEHVTVENLLAGVEFFVHVALRFFGLRA